MTGAPPARPQDPGPPVMQWVSSTAISRLFGWATDARSQPVISSLKSSAAAHRSLVTPCRSIGCRPTWCAAGQPTSPRASAKAVRRSGAPMPPAISSPITNALKSSRARWPGAGWRLPGPPIRSSSSSSRSRVRGCCGCPTARGCGSAMPGRMGANMSASAA